MARRLLSPLKAARPDNWQDIQRILADIHALINPNEFEVTADFEVPDFDGELFLLCTNTTAITITHTDKPKDKSHLIVVRAAAGAVTVNGNGNTINGSNTLTLPSVDDVADIQFFETLDRHLIV